ncbi:MAG: ABC transporter permease [Bryobacteraceae bacterium]|jgi:predicted permease
MTRDFLWALRWLSKNPWFPVAVIVILGLGIGANTAVFSVADAVLLRPPPYRSSERLVRIEEKTPNQVMSVIATDDFRFWEDRRDLFDKAVPYRRDIATLMNAGVPDQVFAVRTSAQLFSLLGVRPSLGRTLVDADDRPNSAHSAVISDRLWRRTFDADPRVIGRTITFSDEAFTIVGVMPPEFEFPLSQEEMWIPLHLNAGSTGAVEVVARLRTGVTAAQSQSAMQAVARQLEQRDPRKKAGLRISVSHWREELSRNYELSAVLILAAVGLVLLIACANVSSLLLSRAVQRQREIAIRASLGAGFWRVTRQLLTESLILALMGSIAGLAIGRVLLRLILRQLAALPFVLPHLQRVALNGRVLLFDAVVCAILASLCSLAPLVFVSRTDVQTVLRGGQADTGRRSTRLFSLLIASEAAFAFLLLAGSGLFMRSLIRLQNADTGFHADHVLTMRVPIGTQIQSNPAGKYDTRARQIEFYAGVLDRLQVVPGVRAVAVVNNRPLSEANTVTEYRGPDGALLPVMTRTISSQYFAVMGIRLLQGRGFSEADQSGAPLVAIINESLAHLFFPERNPIGQFLPSDGAKKTMVVGIVANAWQSRYDQPAAGEIYIPYRQYMFGTFLSTIVVRTSGDPLALAETLRKQIWTLDPNEPVLKVETMDDVISDSIWRPRFSAWIFAALGGLALLLTSAGIYGVVAYTTALRSKEVGIRVALGARPRNIMDVVLRGAMVPLTAGLVAGLVAALILSRLLSSLLYETSHTDPVTYFGAAGLLLAVGIVASMRPAWSAATADPLHALRTE